MSRSSWWRISSGYRWPNVLAISSGVTFATLAASAGAWVDCSVGDIGPLTEGVAFNGLVGGVSGSPGLHRAAVTIDWGDGTSSAGQTGNVICFTPPLAATVCSYGVWGGHTYNQAATRVRIEMQLGGISCAGAAFAVVAPPPPPPGPPPPGGDVLSNPRLLLTRATVDIPVKGVIATFRDSNPSAVVSDFTALIDWGDGTQSAGVVGGSSGTLSVSAPAGGHAYGQTSFIKVSVSLSAPGVASSTAKGRVFVR